MDPFLKWAGGKRWLRRAIGDLEIPDHNRYIEPFLGSGAIFFDRLPALASLSDANEDLINTYEMIRSKPALVLRYLTEYSSGHSDDAYYEIRSKIPKSPSRRAARFLYLNRTCWNGLYRVNQKGEFNVPRGTKNTIILPNEDLFAISAALTNVELRHEDFEAAIDRSLYGDLIYCDPPYTIHHNMNGFLKYNETIFSWSDQVRLRHSLDRALSRGARVIVSNANHESVVRLYDDFGKITTLDRASVISGNNKGRGRYGELLIQAGF